MKSPGLGRSHCFDVKAVLMSLASLSLLASCGDVSYRPTAVGTAGEIVVVMDSLLWNGAPGDALREEIGPYVGTLPAPEPLFDLAHQTIETQAAFDRISTHRSIVFAASLSDSTVEANFVRSVFSEDAQKVISEGSGVFVNRDDIWRRDQRIVYLAASNPDELIAITRKSGEEMRSIFNGSERQRLEKDMYENGRQFELEDTLLTHHDFRIKVQHDYLIATDTTDFVWMRRILADSWRSLFVYYEDYADPNDLTPEWMYRKRDSLGQIYLLGNVGGYINIDYRRPLESKSIDFLDHYAFEARGLWHMIGPDDAGEIVSYGMGGPFVSYGFYDQEGGRIYLIDGMVFAPGFKKREFLRQLEVMAHTIRTRSEIASTVVASVTASGAPAP
ncbi:MAG: DUF4837 family protein [Rhodothermales bacterium]|nr:DUF4837 family protein [Rhodothermales bacterium]